MSQDDSKIEQLKKKLYSQKDDVPEMNRRKLHNKNYLVNNSWQGNQEEPVFEPSEPYYQSHGSVFKKLLLVSLAFFVIAIGIAGYVFYKGTNLVSNNNIGIAVLGPVSSPSGDVLSLNIDVSNNNSSDLLLVDLVLTFPSGTKMPNDQLTQMTSSRIPVGTIKAGSTLRQNVKAALYGQENDKKDIKISLEYRLPGSNTIFVKDKDYPIFIGTSPISVNVDYQSEATVNQDMKMTVHVVSNSTNIVNGVVLKGDYPFGFQYASSDPAPAVGNNVWTLGDLVPGQKVDIVIKGKMLGSENDQRIFQFYAGTEDSKDKTAIGTILVNNSVPIAIKKPFLSADIALNGDNSQVFVTRSGNAIRGELVWENNLDKPVNDVVIQLKIDGNLLDKTSIQAENGFYKSLDNTLTWDRTTLPDLKEVGPGEMGRLQFSFATLAPTKDISSNFRKPELSLGLNISGKRLSEQNVPEQIQSSVTKNIKVASDLALVSKLIRSSGPFTNTGAIPPVIDKETTYTVVWDIYNSFNTIRNGAVTVSIPNYVRWVGNVSPTDARISYSPDQRTITWNVGDVMPGTGFTSSPTEVIFQIGFTPSISQMSQVPLLINNQRIAGTDSFTNTIIESITSALDTKFDQDKAFKYGDDKVVGN